MADDEGIYFDRQINERCRGVSRMGRLDIVLERADRVYSEQKKKELADRKNRYCRDMLYTRLSPNDILPGALDFMNRLRERGIKMATGSSSRNGPAILELIGLAGCFDAMVDGNDITRSKPDPQVFLIAAERLGLLPEECLVVEDAEAGVTTALAAGMRVLAVGFASNDPRATRHAPDLAAVDHIDAVLRTGAGETVAGDWQGKPPCACRIGACVARVPRRYHGTCSDQVLRSDMSGCVASGGTIDAT